MITLNVYRLRNDLVLPTYGTTLANCFDLSFQPTTDHVIGYNKYNNSTSQKINNFGEISIHPGDRLLIPTGLIFKLERNITIEKFSDIVKYNDDYPLRNFSIRLHPRSGLSLKRGLVLANSEGIVDVDYQEQVFVLLTNISSTDQIIKVGERIAQAEVVCNTSFEFRIVAAIPEKHSERAGGFGSTGV